MPPPAYTVRLLSGVLTDSTPLVAGPVPAGMRWVVLSTAITQAAPSGGAVGLSVPGPLYIFIVSMSGITETLTLASHQTVEPGETLTMEAFSTSDSFYVLCTGWQLSTT